MLIFLMILSTLATLFFMKMIAYHPASMAMAAFFAYLTWLCGRQSIRNAELNRKLLHLEEEALDLRRPADDSSKGTKKRQKFHRIKIFLITFGFIYFTFGYLRFAAQVTSKMIMDNIIQFLAFAIIVVILIPSDGE